MTQQAVYQLGGKSFVENEWFVARITAVGSSTGSGSCDSIPYGWIEQRVCNNGLNYQNVEINSRPQFGETALDKSPAFAIGDGTAQVDDIVLMRARGITPSGYPVMEFIPKSSGVSGEMLRITVVTNVSCVNGSIVVIKKTYEIPGAKEIA